MDFGEVSVATGADKVQNFGIEVPPPCNLKKPGRVLITGASTGIGWDTAVHLAELGWQVLVTARRRQRLAQLSGAIGAKAFCADLTKEDQVEALVRWALCDGPVDAIVNNAGGAIGLEKVEVSEPDNWREMYERNVMSSLLVTKAFLPSLVAQGGDIVFITSTAALDTYAGGAGYVAAKHAQAQIPHTLRLELVGKPVRVIEICPGLVQTPEFSLTRLGDQVAAQQVYDKVKSPLSGLDIARSIAWALAMPAHVNIDQLVIRPVEQASNYLQKRLS